MSLNSCLNSVCRTECFVPFRVKRRLHDILHSDKDFSDEDIEKVHC